MRGGANENLHDGELLAFIKNPPSERIKRRCLLHTEIAMLRSGEKRSDTPKKIAVTDRSSYEISLSKGGACITYVSNVSSGPMVSLRDRYFLMSKAFFGLESERYLYCGCFVMSYLSL